MSAVFGLVNFYKRPIRKDTLLFRQHALACYGPDGNRHTDLRFIRLRNRCLVEAIVARLLLRRRGIPTQLFLV